MNRLKVLLILLMAVIGIFFFKYHKFFIHRDINTLEKDRVSTAEPEREPEPIKETEENNVEAEADVEKIVKEEVKDVESEPPSKEEIPAPKKEVHEAASLDNSIVFLGDSLTEGLEIYGFFPEAVIKGVNSLNTISAREQVYGISALHPEKLFILLGINDLWEGDSIEDFIQRYRGLIEEFKLQTPETRIYIESLMPVSVVAVERNHQISNPKIDKANMELRALAEELNVNYIDVSSQLKDDNGNMKSEYTNDGVHIIDVYYHIWADTLAKYAKN